MNKGKLPYKLYKAGIIKFGNFTLRSGEQSSIYFNLRELISYPDLISEVVKGYVNISHLNKCIKKDQELGQKRVCGVAYTGIPLAALYSQELNLPMIMKRKERKEYGTKQILEGDYKPGDSVILIDDVITSGGSLLETIETLEEEGLVVAEILVLIDRRGKSSNLKNPKDLNMKEYPVATLYTMNELLWNLKRQGIKIPKELKLRNSFYERIALAQTEVGRKLMRIVEEKKTNLVFSADLKSSQALLKIIDQVGPEVCMIKTHVDILEDFDYSTLIPKLLELAERHNFLICEDRKLADIGNTVKNQYTGGIYRIAEWADLITVHPLLGPGILDALVDEIRSKKFITNSRGILLLAELSNDGNLIDEKYRDHCCQMAQNYSDIVIGLICQGKLLGEGFLHITPGVNLEVKNDNGDQLYKTPRDVIGQQGTDLVIVGRGIYEATNCQEAARKYRQASWIAYKEEL